MNLSDILSTKDKCKENECRVNRQNIKYIYDVENGILNKDFFNNLFGNLNFKICDCIIVCNNGDIKLIEILCGTLTYEEYQDKKKQLENCFKIIEELGLQNNIKQISIIYKKRDKKTSSLLTKKLISNEKIKNKLLTTYQYENNAIDINCS